MSHVPFPLRVAAGLAVTTAERVRSLPKQLVQLPVTVISEVLQASMRVQQHVTELAIKGDDVLSSLRRPEEEPEWATFDEDLDEDVDEDLDEDLAEDVGEDLDYVDDATDGGRRSDTGLADDLRDDSDDDPWAEEERALAAEHTDGEFDSPAVATGPAVMGDYDELTLPQVRARLRSLSLEQLEELFTYEREHADRPSFTGMLGRRIANVRQAEG